MGSGLQEIIRKAARIRLLVLDVDGVLTDGLLHYASGRQEFKSFQVRDGFGIQRALQAGIEVAVISGRRSQAVQNRMAELNVPHVLLGAADKLRILRELVAELAVPMDAVACIGDDVPDLQMMSAAGLSVAVADAHPDVLACADWQTRLGGGKGAVREVCDLLVSSRHGGPGV
jgi:3-deoxy-D-manno-octulosonate 8-phosphate phosphatase (KDO 8-P phosphatase)